MKQILTPAALATVLVFFPLRTINQTAHLLHRLIFKGRLFYLPPSDADVAALLPAQLQGHKALTSKERKRLIKRAQASAMIGGAKVELQLTKVELPLYASMGSRRYAQMETFIAVHLTVLFMVAFEQLWISYRTEHAVVQPDGSVAPIVQHAGVTSSTIVALTAGLLYDIWLGVSTLSSSAHASPVGGSDGTVDGTVIVADASQKYWRRSVAVLSGIIFSLTLLVQSLGRYSAAFSSFLLRSDASYSSYLNQIGFNLLTAMHQIVEDGIRTANVAQASADGVRSFLPLRPSTPEDVHWDAYFPLLTFQLFLSLLSTIMTTAFLCGAWRYAKLLAAAMQDLADQWNERGEEALTMGGRVKVAGEYALAVWNFVSPLFVTLLFIPTLSLQPFLTVCLGSASSSSVDPISHHNASRLFTLFRCGFILLCLLLRLTQVRALLQTYLFSSLALIRTLPGSGTLDQHTALRIQTVLKGVFWYAPMVVLQLVYPIGLSALLLCAVKLSSEYTPVGLSTPNPQVQLAREAGWGVGYLAFGTGNSPFLRGGNSTGAVEKEGQESAVERVEESVPITPVVVVDPLDADEFDGDVQQLEEAEVDTSSTVQPHTASSTSGASSSFSSLLPPPSLLSSFFTFLLLCSHLLWFLASAIALAWYRFGSGSGRGMNGQQGGLTTRAAVSEVQMEKKTVPSGPQGGKKSQ